MLTRRRLLSTIVTGSAMIAAGGRAAAQGEATLYKNPGCECCDGYADDLRRHGIAVKVVPTEQLAATKGKAGVPAMLEGCHTTLIGGYAIEGHVPMAAVKRLLAERPTGLRGIALPGMPTGSPGMSGPKTEIFVTFSFARDGAIAAYDVE